MPQAILGHWPPMPQRTLAASSRADRARLLSSILCRHTGAVNRHVAGLAGPDQHG